MTLYELTDDYLALLEMAEDPDIDEQALKDTMEGIEGALEIKAEGYAKIIRMLEGDAAVCDAESKRLRNKKQAIERNIDRMKKALQYSMVQTGKTKFKTALFSFGIQKNPASVVIDHAGKVPASYWIPQPTGSRSRPNSTRRQSKPTSKRTVMLIGLIWNRPNR